MIRRISAIVPILGLLAAAPAPADSGEAPVLLDLRVPHMLPYVSVRSDGRLEGMIGELIEMIRPSPTLAVAREEPWARLTRDLKSTPEAIGLPMGRTPSREGEYCWIVPLASDDVVLVSLRPEGVDLKTRPTVEILRGSTVGELVPGLDSARIDWATDTQQAFTKLLRGRADAMLASRAVIEGLAANGGQTMPRLFYSPPLAKMTIYLVANPDYPRDKARLWRTAMQRFTASAHYADFAGRHAGHSLRLPSAAAIDALAGRDACR